VSRPVDANDLLTAYMNRASRVTPIKNAGSVAQILDDLVDLGTLRRRPDRSGGPPEWELVVKQKDRSSGNQLF
jgi:hypothetical protein